MPYRQVMDAGDTIAQTVPERVERQVFWSLTEPLRADGGPRRTGVEIELAGLTEVEVAECVRGLWGGRIEADDPTRFRIEDTRLGRVTVLRDSALSRSGVEGVLLEALGDMVPVEVVTPPLAPDEMPEADALVRALRVAGARGTRDALRFGFGMHLNPEVVAPTAEAILPVVRAYGLLEDWLRATDPLDPARRLLPFVDPWPRALVDRLAQPAPPSASSEADAAAPAVTLGALRDLSDLAAAYLALTPTRNRGLDLLPLLEHLEPAQVRAALPEGRAKGGRPTYHYRLPEARVDEPSWSVAYEWNRWVLVERVAARPALLEALAEEWRAHRSALLTIRPDWARMVEAHLLAARIWEG
ncbi:MAG: amidoligase family protein [Alkalilacustris sp.]